LIVPDLLLLLKQSERDSRLDAHRIHLPHNASQCLIVKRVLIL
jgi:hypothetical protein